MVHPIPSSTLGKDRGEDAFLHGERPPSNAFVCHPVRSQGNKEAKRKKERESDPPCFGGARLEHRRRRRELNPGLLRDRQEYSPLYYDDRVA